MTDADTLENFHKQDMLQLVCDISAVKYGVAQLACRDLAHYTCDVLSNAELNLLDFCLIKFKK